VMVVMVVMDLSVDLSVVLVVVLVDLDFVGWHSNEKEW
jgi:hypothetical protein